MFKHRELELVAYDREEINETTVFKHGEFLLLELITEKKIAINLTINETTMLRHRILNRLAQDTEKEGLHSALQ